MKTFFVYVNGIGWIKSGQHESKVRYTNDIVEAIEFTAEGVTQITEKFDITDYVFIDDSAINRVSLD